MIFHASIPADDPERVARVIAELWHGEVFPFVYPESLIVVADDDRGTGSHLNPETGHACDDVRPSVEQIEWLSAADKRLIFEDTAKKVFKLKA